MTDIHRPPDLALTKAEYDALNLTRPLCNGEIGSTTQRKRTVCAELSAIVTETLGYIPPRKQGETE